MKKREIITNSLNVYIPNSKKISETVLSTKINILYEDFLRKKYKIIINEKQLNSYLKNF